MALDPITRKELFLARVAGQNVTTPDPITREELFLQEIIDNQVTEEDVEDIIEEAIGGLITIDYAFVETLPATGVKGTIYFVPATGGAGTDYYDEYLWLPSKQGYEHIGTTRVDLSNYYTKSETNTLLGGKQNTLTFDSTPTANSTNPVTSGGIKTYVDTAVTNSIQNAIGGSY